MVNINILKVVTSLSMYHCTSNWNMFWEETFTGKKKLFYAVNMQKYGHRKVRKHR